MIKVTRMKKFGKLLMACSFITCMSGCGEEVETIVSEEPVATVTSVPTQEAVAVTTDPVPTPETLDVDSVEQLMNSMSVEQKVAQLFIVQPEALVSADAPVLEENVDGVKVLTDQMRDTLYQIPVGGIAIFGKNVESPGQITKLINDFQATNPNIPLFTTIDEEGGLVARLARNDAFGLPKYESAEAVGKQGSQAVSDMYHTIGSYLHQYGFNVDFAPVADINSNPDNPVIGTRAFGSTAEEISPLIQEAVKALQEEGVMATLKHFPGHGDTVSDSHLGTVSIDFTMEELYAHEFVPFSAGIEAGAKFVMVGHINTPNATQEDVPASLSYQIMTECLRHDLGFDGLIITDALEMQAISDVYPSDEAVVKSFLAGTDLLLMPMNFTKAYEGMIDAVHSGRISQERLDESVYRILKVKQEAGILQF